jgi:hypothetical protein
VALAILTALCLGPCLPVLWKERALAEDFRSFATGPMSHSKEWINANETQLRQQGQRLARAKGFHLPLHDVVLVYPAQFPKPNLDDPFVKPKNFGYTLSIPLPMFGVFPYTVQAVRVFPVSF